MAKKYLAVINNGTEDLYLQDLEAQASIEEIKETIKNGSSFIGKFVSAVVGGETVTTLNDGDAPTSITTTKGTYVPGTPAEGQTQLNNGDYTIIAGTGGAASLEFMWDGNAFSEFGSTSVLKGLAFKDSASGSYTPAGTNSASAVSLSGEAKSKMVTTSVYGVGGEETVHDTPTLNTTNITGVNGSTTTHDTPTLNTTDIVGVDGSVTTHDTPTLNTTNIVGVDGSVTTHDTPTLNTTNVKEVDTFTQGTLPSMTYDETNKKLTFNAGALASLATKNTAVGTSLTAGSAVTVPVAAAAATAVGTSLTAGAAVTVPVAAAAATAVGTSLTAGAAVTVPVAADAATAVGISLTAGTAKTVATKAAAATTVATGALDAEGAGAEVVTQSNNAGTAAAQVFTGTAGTVTVS